MNFDVERCAYLSDSLLQIAYICDFTQTKNRFTVNYDLTKYDLSTAKARQKLVFIKTK